MHNQSDMKAAGFTISPVLEGCTKVASAVPFFYFNRRFASNPLHLASKLEAAKMDEESGAYQMISAGSFGEGEDLPFGFISVGQAEKIKAADNAYQAAMRNQEMAYRDLMDAAAV